MRRRHRPPRRTPELRCEHGVRARELRTMYGRAAEAERHRLE